MKRIVLLGLLLLLAGTGSVFGYRVYRNHQGEPVITIERQAPTQEGYDLIARVERGDIPCPFAASERDGEITFACITEESMRYYSDRAQGNPRAGENDWKFDSYSYRAEVTFEMPEGMVIDYYDENGEGMTEDLCRSELGESFLTVHQTEEHVHTYGNLGADGALLERWVFFTTDGQPVCQTVMSASVLS